jgi:hypothetical protein
MHSTQNPQQTDDPHDVLMVAPDVVLAPTDEELAKLARTLRHPSNPHTRTASDLPGGSAVPRVDTTFRAAAVRDIQVTGDRPSIGRKAVRAFTGFLLVACIGIAAIAWRSHGDAAKQIIARWASQLVTSSPPVEDPGLPEQPNPPTIQASAAEAAPPQPAPLAQTAPEGVAPTAAALSPESAPLLESMAGDLATAGQEIKRLKGSIEQLKANIEQLKASQEQMSRDIAKVSEQNLRPRISAPAPRSAAAPARKLIPPFAPPQAAAAPMLPQAAAPSAPQQPEPQPQATAQPETEPVPRPPMPVR